LGYEVAVKCWVGGEKLGKLHWPGGGGWWPKTGGEGGGALGDRIGGVRVFELVRERLWGLI